MVTDYYKPFFLFEHKDYYFLIDNGIGRMFQGNEQFPKHITKKIEEILTQGYRKGCRRRSERSFNANFDPPVMFATTHGRSKN